ncbi:MAG: STAS domain-containing protein [bacterium]|nr:STAS domain-containing protein [Candidatus Sumerlaeota bacterium]
MLDYSYDEAARTLTCTFLGRLDTQHSAMVVEMLQRKLDECLGTKTDAAQTQDSGAQQAAAENPLKIVFDLSRVDYVASGFIRLCGIAAKSVPAGNFSIRNTRPAVKKVFVMAGLDHVLNVS